MIFYFPLYHMQNPVSRLAEMFFLFLGKKNISGKNHAFPWYGLLPHIYMLYIAFLYPLCMCRKKREIEIFCIKPSSLFCIGITRLIFCFFGFQKSALFLGNDRTENLLWFCPNRTLKHRCFILCFLFLSIRKNHGLPQAVWLLFPWKKLLKTHIFVKP